VAILATSFKETQKGVAPLINRLFLFVILLTTLPSAAVQAQGNRDRDLAHLLASFTRYHSAIERQALASDSSTGDLRLTMSRHIGISVTDYAQLTSVLAKRRQPPAIPRTASQSERALAFKKKEDFLTETLRLLRSRLSPSGIEALEDYLLGAYRANFVAIPVVTK